MRPNSAKAQIVKISPWAENSMSLSIHLAADAFWSLGERARARESANGWQSYELC